MGKVQVELVNKTGENLTIREEVTVGRYNKDQTLPGDGGSTVIDVDPNSTYFVMWVIKGTDGSNVVDLTSDQLIDNEKITILIDKDGKYITEAEPRPPTVVKLLSKASKMFAEKKPPSLGDNPSNHPVPSASGSKSSNHGPLTSIKTETLPPQEPVAEPAPAHKHKRFSFFSFFRRGT
ncbi:unnamed protein product [Sphagnum jensenii]|jgi:hypothetical protein|uniref:DUF7748 domain-containing protein n=1 Tax=Sphagnum jensenii TaxID=128206 RepID=A0ABP0W1U3_9BRYO